MEHYHELGPRVLHRLLGIIRALLLWQPWRIAYLRFLNRMIDYMLVMVEVNITKCQSGSKTSR